MDSSAPSVREQLNAHLERVTLWLERHRLVFPDRLGGSPTDDDAAALERIEAELARIEADLDARVAACRAAGEPSPLEQLRERLGLSSAEVDVLVALFANETEPDFHRAYRRAAQDGERQIDNAFVAELVAGRSASRGEHEAALLPSGVLARHGLVTLGGDRSWVPRAPLLFLKPKLGAQLESFLQAIPDGRGLCAAFGSYTARRRLDELVLPDGVAENVRAALARSARPGGGFDPVALVGVAHSGRKALLAAAAPEGRLVVVRAGALPTDLDALDQLVREAICEAVIRGAALHIDDADALLADDRLEQRRRLAFLLSDLRVRVFFAGERAPDALVDLLPGLGALDLPVIDDARQLSLWMLAIPRDVHIDAGCDFPTLSQRYSLPAGTICRAVEEMARTARRESPARPTLTMPSALATVRRQLGNRFGDLAQHVASTFSWEDLILPQEILERVLEVAMFARHRNALLRDWGFERKLPYGRSISVLLAGDPGTGKTMVASLLAKELGLELFRVNVSRVTDKYIGETEKNLGRIFSEAQRGQVALLFDEADSLFSKRTEVRSSTDRYSNLAVNYLLQAVESHDGVILLTSNHEKAIDDAFRRRIRYRIVFPMPGPADRARLWQSMVPPEAKLEPPIDWSALGREFDMSGGPIKNAVLRGALYAMSSQRPLSMELLRRAGLVELEELGRLVSSSASSALRSVEGDRVRGA